jgi:antitoxin VapB
MPTARTKTFMSGNSEAVRLPKEVAFGQPGLELTVERHGDVVMIYPVKDIRRGLARLAALGPLPEEARFVRPPFEAPDRKW